MQKNPPTQARIMIEIEKRRHCAVKTVKDFSGELESLQMLSCEINLVGRRVAWQKLPSRNISKHHCHSFINALAEAAAVGGAPAKY